MCGIVGLYTYESDMNARRAQLSAMTRALKHRGPDHQGEWWDEAVPLGLGHRRLSIVDVSMDGAQPMRSPSGRYVIAYNGEIYNFLRLRADLEAAGHFFRGRSDTEVFLAAIEAWGLNAALQKINGMFAMILWDQVERRLHLMRDPLGKKPLYVGFAGQDLVMASELKSFFAHPNFEKNISPVSVAHYLRLGFVPAPHSIFDRVWMLRPGCRMMIDPVRVHPGIDLSEFMDPYFHLPQVVEQSITRRGDMTRMSGAERARATEDLITTCVRDRMVADVPLGAFLSGGVDSSLVVALMQKQADRPVQTFAIGFEEAGYNEAGHAAQVAAHLGTDHHSEMLSADAARAIIPDLPQMADEPLADASIIPTFLLSKFARESVTVALTGDGGDELFGGYYRHRHLPQIMMLMRVVPKTFRQMMISVLGAVAAGGGQGTARLEKLTQVMAQRDITDVYESLIGMAEENAVTQVPRPKTGYPFRMASAWPAHLSVRDWARYADTIHYLPGDVLTKVDRATMRVGLEARAPLLDTRLLAHAWSLPPSDLISGSVGKKILRHILYKHVPHDMVDRPKQGFSVPMDSWLRGSLKEWGAQMLQNPNLYTHTGLGPHAVKMLWDDHQRGLRGRVQTLWRLMVLSAWMEAWKI